ncbi:MAG: hypothetical protein HYZ17_13810 [Betaproteobacteria bacterium]|nr:hypothetical protein [Betaproteobacteria bacterium]
MHRQPHPHLPPVWQSLFVLLLLTLAHAATAQTEGSTAETRAERHYQVGHRIITLAESKTAPALTLAVWYPTAAETRPHTYGGPTLGRVALDAAPLAVSAPYPLLVFSHGYGGGGIGAVFFTEALAARGWIVVCPDHRDRHSAVRSGVGQVPGANMRGLLRHAGEIAASTPMQRVNYHYRIDEMRQALDGVLVSPDFGPLIDRQRIAVGGHSFGGYTALGVGGTLPEYHDPRIKALLLFSTGAGAYLFEEVELARVKVPSMLFLGEREATQKRGAATMRELSERIYRNLPAPKYFLEVRGADHFSFNNRFSDRPGARLMSGSEAQFDLIRRYALAFLERHVAGREGRDLDQTDPLLSRYVHPKR